MDELELKLETVEVKGGEKIKLTVRNVFYRGFIGKLKTIWYWLYLIPEYHNITPSEVKEELTARLNKKEI